MMKRLLFAVVVCGLAMVPSAKADTVGTSEVFTLNIDGCTGGCGTGSTVFGTITLTQTAVGVVTVDEVLNSPSAFVDTGAGSSLVFSLAGNPAITFGGLDPTKWSTGTAGKDSPFPGGEYDVDCGGLSCGPGASKTNPGPLVFTVTDAAVGGVNVSDFISQGLFNGAPIFFSSDIIGPNKNSDGVGRTGDVGAGAGVLSITPPVPEPSSLMLLGTGALGLAGVVRRRFSH